MTKETCAPSHCTYERDGLTLAYSVRGDGHPILFVHGFPEFWYGWRKQLEEFAPSHPCLAIDLIDGARNQYPLSPGSKVNRISTKVRVELALDAE